MNIPANIDHLQIIHDLKAMGWRDNKIEIACGFSDGYIEQLRRKNIKDMSYARAARLYNFWIDEAELQPVPIRALAETSSA